MYETLMVTRSVFPLPDFLIKSKASPPRHPKGVRNKHGNQWSELLSRSHMYI